MRVTEQGETISEKYSLLGLAIRNFELYASAILRATTQKQAAKQLGITQPRLNQLLKHKVDLFSLDALVNIATRAGMQVKLTVKKAA